MNHARLRFPRAALITLLLVLGGAIVPWVPKALADEDDLSDAVHISSVDPELYNVGDDLLVAVETKLPVGSDWLVETFLQPTPFGSLWEMDAFLEGVGFPGWRLSSTESAVPSNGALSWTIDADQMPWPESLTTGGRGLVVRFSNAGGAVHEARTVLIYEPLEKYPQTRVNVVLSDDGSLDPRDLGNLAQRDGITIAAPTPKEDTDSESETRSPLQVALDREGVEIISVPIGGSDPSALAGANLPLLLDLSLSSKADAQNAGYKKATVFTNVILASSGGFTQDAIGQLGGNIIVAPRSWGDDSRWEAYVTPTSLVRTDIGGSALTIIDNWASAADLLNAKQGSPSEELVLRQRLRLLTMMVGLQDPEDQRTLLVRHTEGLSLDQEDLGLRLDALLGPDWVDPTSFSKVLTSPTSQVSRAEVPRSSGSTADYRRRLLPLEEEYEQALAVSLATDEGPSALRPFEEEMLEATGSQLGGKEQKRLVTKAVGELKTVTESIQVLPLSTVNMVHQDANFPVSVANQGESGARVKVAIESTDPRLQTVEEVDTEVPAGGQTEVLVPVKAVGAGDIEVRIVVRTPNGDIVDDSQTVVVRVRPNWEDIGTVVVSVAALGLFSFGLLRSFRSARQRSRSE